MQDLPRPYHTLDLGEQRRRGARQVPELLDPELAAYMCGPAAFMAGIQDALLALGFNTARLHQESFSF